MVWPKIPVTELGGSHVWTLCVTLVMRCRFLLDVEIFALQHEINHMNRMWIVNPLRSVRKFRRVPHRFIRTYLLQEIAAPEERHKEAQHDHWNCCLTDPQS